MTPVLQLQYSRQALIKIRNSRNYDKSPGQVEIPFNLSEPLKTYSEEIAIQDSKYQLSYSILPGLDPKHDTEKLCQDNCFALVTPDSVFMGLYDGHGLQGELVAEFCSKLAQKLFLSFESSVTPSQCDPLKFLEDTTHRCDQELLTSGIDIALSGW